QLHRLREQLGLDQPVWVQYGRFISDALRGNLGVSIQSNRPALDDVVTAFPVTLQLALASLLLASLCGVPVGVLAAVRQGSRFGGGGWGGWGGVWWGRGVGGRGWTGW